MKSYLHIGLEKTGTTSIQAYLADNRARLLERGVLYPTSPGDRIHLDLVSCCRVAGSLDELDRGYLDAADRDRRRAELRRQLEAEVGRADARVMILSNEQCSSRLTSVDELERLRDLLSDLGADLTVVVYLRRQDEYHISRYSTILKSGGSAHLDDIDPLRRPEVFDYARLLDLWASVFGEDRIRVRIFHRSRLVGGDAVLDFLELAEIELQPDDRLPTRLNPSLGVFALEFLRRFNEAAIRAGSVDEDTRASLIRALASCPDGGGPVSLSPDARSRIVDHYEESNAAVARRFLDRDDGALFPPVTTSEERLPSLDLDRAISIMEQVWRRLASRGTPRLL